LAGWATAAGNAYFITRRFDRYSGNRRRHIHSVARLVHFNFHMPDFPIPKEQASDIQRHMERQRSRLRPPSA